LAKRFGMPEDLTVTVQFLSSAASDFMTGQVLLVDGGFLTGADTLFG
jgi:NAD(P)-dependent dehydrogenase (short-subunit alcohol dehydrogenase family)